MITAGKITQGKRINAHAFNAGCMKSNVAVSSAEPKTWKGSYVFEPDQTGQRIPVSGYYMADDIIIQKIPSCYGMVSYNGYALRIV